jgi:hypothetical protein
MEYVDGEPIDIYCDSRSLSVEQRLRLFQVVCSAGAPAHQNLIVHPRLKPFQHPGRTRRHAEAARLRHRRRE